MLPGSRSLLCIWHINKNVLAYASRAFPTEELRTKFMQMWCDVISTPSIADFQNRCHELRMEFYEYYNLIRYLDNTWMPLCLSFATCWTKLWLHLGNTSTSRVEGTHHVLKNYLQVLTGDLKARVDRVTFLLTSQIREIWSGIETERQRTPPWLTVPVLSELLGHITPFALRKIYHQWEISQQAPLTRCTEVFRATMGLPCAHEIQK